MKKISRIVLDKHSYPLYVGGSKEEKSQISDRKGSSVLLEAEVYSDSYSVIDVQWLIEDSNIIYFDTACEEMQDGSRRRVRAKRTGVTTVIARLPDGAHAECHITVIDNYVRFTVSEIALNLQKLHLKIGESAQLIPILYPKDIYQNGMLDSSLKWESSDEDIISIQDGKVSALGIGEADVKAYTGDAGCFAKCHVVTSENISPLVHKDMEQEVCELCIGETLELINAGDEREKRRQIQWSSSNRYIADVKNNGCVTAYSASVERVVETDGLRVYDIPKPIWVYATDSEGGRITRYPVLVKPDSVPVYNVSLYPFGNSLPVGESGKVTAVVCPSALKDYRVLWKSSDESILSIREVPESTYGESQAVVSANRPGEALIEVTVEGITSSCRIQVTSAIVKNTAVCLSEQLVMDVDQVVQLHPVLDEYVTNTKIYWLGNDFDIASLDREGNVQGYHIGECIIYAIAEDSLSLRQKDVLKELQEKRKFSIEDEKLQELLSGSVYGECKVLVKDECNALRNLHIVEESVTDHSALLLWNRTTLLDVPEFDQYQVICNGALLSKTKKLGYRAENLSPSTVYRFEVAALGKGGNILRKSVVSITTKGRSQVVNVMDYGASGNGLVMDTSFIQRAINECPKSGTVLLPENHIFVSGALFLKSDMTFKVDGILLGSGNPKDYPKVITKWEGWRKVEQPADSWVNTTAKVPDNHCAHASLLNAGGYEEGESGSTGPYNLENLVICGKGQINGNGFVLAYNEGANINTIKVASLDWPIKDATSRGSAIRIHNGRNIYLKDIQVAYAPGWTIHSIFCEHITFDGMEVVSQGDGDFGWGTDVRNCGHVFNGDGIDPESCVHVNLFNIFFTTGDDAVAIKSGRNREGNDLDKPNAYIRITDCISRWSLGGFGTGSETAAGSHDLLFQNLTVEDVLISGIWLKTCLARGGITEYIQVRDLYTARCNSPIWIFHNYSSTSIHANPAATPPSVRHIIFENIHGEESNELGIRLEGTSEIIIEDIQLRGIQSNGRENRINYCKNLRMID